MNITEEYNKKSDYSNYTNNVKFSVISRFKKDFGITDKDLKNYIAEVNRLENISRNG